MPTLLDLYHHLPYWGKVAVASARGQYLKHWRYGKDHESLVEEILQRDFWDDEKWKSWREDRLSRLLFSAVKDVPYYREMWSSLKRKGVTASSEYLENWPLLDKATIRANPFGFISDRAEPNKMFKEHTSGSTGSPLQLWWTRETVRSWYAMSEARIRRWNGISLHDRWAILGGQLIVNPSRQKPPFWVWNSSLNQLYLSSYHLGQTTATDYIDALQRHKIKYILGYTSTLHTLAIQARELCLAVPTMTAILTNAEPVYEYQRHDIESVFNCRVFEQYGMAEIVVAASECTHGRLHLWHDVGITELFERDIQGQSTDVGELLCTGLVNMEMPLIRYRTGDRADLSVTQFACACGRTLPCISSIEGRIDDVILTPDGREIGRMDPVFKIDIAIREAQIIQESATQLCIKVVPVTTLKSFEEALIISRVRDRVGEMNIRVEQVKAIPRIGSGKLKGVVSHVRKTTK